jgi:hypothetical protein
MGHRGAEATKKVLSEVFTWHGMPNDVELFVRHCLQCECVAGAMVPRPLGQIVHAVEPNKLIHCDFVSLPDGCALVTVDDASGVCMLTWHDGCKANDTVDAMLE